MRVTDLKWLFSRFLTALFYLIVKVLALTVAAVVLAAYASSSSDLGAGVALGGALAVALPLAPLGPAAVDVELLDRVQGHAHSLKAVTLATTTARLKSAWGSVQW